MKKKQVLIIGATGMLGHVVYNYLQQTGEFELSNAVYRTKLTVDSMVCNVKNKQEVILLFEKTNPDIVINCVGALVQESRDNPESAIYLNALFPFILKNLCNQYNAKLIHVSTDCVFSGKNGNYKEDDFRDADDIYGRSKALGEIFDEPHCTLRTSIIGPELKENGTGLFHWFMKQTQTVNGYQNAYWSGVTTHELAKAIHKTIKHNLTGVLHVTNGEVISKYELLTLFNNLREKKLTILPNKEYYANKSLQKSNKFDFEVPSFKKMISEMTFFKGTKS